MVKTRVIRYKTAGEVKTFFLLRSCTKCRMDRSAYYIYARWHVSLTFALTGDFKPAPLFFKPHPKCVTIPRPNFPFLLEHFLCLLQSVMYLGGPWLPFCAKGAPRRSQRRCLIADEVLKAPHRQPSQSTSASSYIADNFKISRAFGAMIYNMLMVTYSTVCQKFHYCISLFCRNE